MRYDRMPLYPPACPSEPCLRLPLFGGCNSGCESWFPQEYCQTVRLENPACPGEYAEIRLSVDECGSLSICVHRPPKPCPPPRPYPRPGHKKPCHRPW